LDKEKNKNKRLWIILAIVVVVLLIGIIIALVILLNKSSANQNIQQNETVVSNASSMGAIAYESNVVTTDEKTLQMLVDQMVEKAKEGTMALEMKTEAVSSNGTDFSCYIGNAVNNQYDMFVVIYLDDTQEEIYRSGLIPLGARIESFTSSKTLDPGSYVGTIVYNQVEDDQATIHAQVNVGINLIVQ